MVQITISPSLHSLTLNNGLVISQSSSSDYPSAITMFVDFLMRKNYWFWWPMRVEPLKSWWSEPLTVWPSESGLIYAFSSMMRTFTKDSLRHIKDSLFSRHMNRLKMAWGISVKAPFKAMDFGGWNLAVLPIWCKASLKSGALYRNRNGYFCYCLSNCLCLCSTEPFWRTGSLIRHSHPGLAPIGLPKKSEGNAIV